MKTIWKFNIAVGDSATVGMPHGARLVHAEPSTFDTIDIWAIVDPDANQIIRHFTIRGTGHPVGDAIVGDYFRTIKSGPYMWHIFDCGEE